MKILALLIGLAGQAAAAPIPPTNAILNQSTLQTGARFNVQNGTIAGTLTAATVNISGTLTVNIVAGTTGNFSGTVTAAQFVGGGAGITGVPAATVPASGVQSGNLGSGVIPTNVATPAHGGTGNDWSGVVQGRLPYFSGTGTLSALATGTANSVLQTGGASANPSWTNAPTVLGTNVTAIPTANISSGNLGSGVIPTNVATPAHGGTGNDWSGVVQGNVPYFNGTGTLAALAPGAANSLLQSNGAAANPSYTSAPTISGANITAIPAAAISSGNLGSGVIPTNVATTAHGGTGQDWSSVAQGRLPYFSASGTMSTLAPGTANTILQSNGAGADPSYTGSPTILGTNITSIPAANIAAGNLGSSVIPTNIATPAHGGTGNDWSGVTAGRLPYFTGTGALGTLAVSSNGRVLSLAAGVPSWTAAASSATNVAGGAVGSLPYQSAANTTAMLAAGTNGYVLTMAGGLPSWAAGGGGGGITNPYGSAMVFQDPSFDIGGSTFVTRSGLVGIGGDPTAFAGVARGVVTTPDLASNYGAGLVYAQDLTTPNTIRYTNPILMARKNLAHVPVSGMTLYDTGGQVSLSFPDSGYGYGFPNVTTWLVSPTYPTTGEQTDAHAMSFTLDGSLSVNRYDFGNPSDAQFTVVSQKSESQYAVKVSSTDASPMLWLSQTGKLGVGADPLLYSGFSGGVVLTPDILTASTFYGAGLAWAQDMTTDDVSRYSCPIILPRFHLSDPPICALAPEVDSNGATAAIYFGALGFGDYAPMNEYQFSLSADTITAHNFEAMDLRASRLLLSIPLSVASTSTLQGDVVAQSSVTVNGQTNFGWEEVVNNCGAGVATCTATCSNGNRVTGCGTPSVAAVAGLAVSTGGSSNGTSCTATALTATTISARAYCARVGN